MKRIILFFIVLFAIQANAQLPPLLDRELFFGDPEISGAQISPNGQFISFIKPFNNVKNIWIKKRREPFDKARPLTNDEKRPVTGYFWSRDSKYILYVQDKGGDENYRIYAVDALSAGDPVPPARDLTPIKKVRATIIAVPRDTPNEIIVGLNDRNPQLHDVYKINLTTGKRTLIRQNNENIAEWITDQKGNLRLGVRLTPDGGEDIMKVDGKNLVSIYSVNSEEEANPIHFTADGNSFYMITNKGNDVDKSRLELFDLKTGKIKFIEKDPLNEVDFGGALFSELTDKLLVTGYVGDRGDRLYYKDKAFEKDLKKLIAQVGDGIFAVSSKTKDEKTWIVSVSTDVDPGSVYIYDCNTYKAELLYHQRPDLPSKYLAKMKPVRYKARDGLTIHAYLTLPKGIPSKNLPAVVIVHGGPWARDRWGYDPEAQFLANRGYAVLMPNFRGSEGYGKQFVNAGNKQWGGKILDDVNDGVKYLIRQGIADPKRIAISGGSFGGYETLAGLAFNPNLYAAGFDIAGPSNLVAFIKSIPPYWEPIKKLFAVRVGDINNPEDLKMLEKQSPLNSVKRITAPLYVVQGANDPRVKKAEADQIIAKLHGLGRDVEYMVAPDEGHGFAGKLNNLAMYTAMEEFFAKHIGGRVQKDIRKAIKDRLDSITVDVNTVKMPEINK